jgi:hypothetical protein
VALALSDLGDALAEAGAVVGGGAALGAATAFTAGAILRDAGFDAVEPLRWAERGAAYGGVFGLSALLWRGLGVS